MMAWRRHVLAKGGSWKRAPGIWNTTCKALEAKEQARSKNLSKASARGRGEPRAVVGGRQGPGLAPPLLPSAQGRFAPSVP